MGTICGGVCGCRQNWEVPETATRVLLAASIGHVLPAIVRTGPARPGADTADIARDWDVPGLLPSSRNPQ